MKPNFSPGNNIAMKVPVHEFDSTVAFYRDILGLEQTETSAVDIDGSVTFDFGDKTLWIDKSKSVSQAEIWLEVVTDDIELAAEHLHRQDCIRCDEIETLPPGFKGFWVTSPSNIIHLINE